MTLALVAHIAYHASMSTNGNVSPRRLRRQARLKQLVAGYPGGAAQLARDAGTPKSHISALCAGRRGLGDALAAKLEQVSGLPPEWMDRDD